MRRKANASVGLKRPGFPGGSGYWIPIKGWSVRYAS
ncbi:transposase [Mycobacterium xenopi]|nr:transposase [Mycobacterium xenopi]